MAKKANGTTVETPKAPETPDTPEANGQPVETVFDTAEEARANRPEEKHPKWRLWAVQGPDGATRYAWAPGADAAFKFVCGAAGWKAQCLDRKPANPAMVAGLLASLTPEDRAALLAQYAPPAKPKK
jgi:hypothetical protein